MAIVKCRINSAVLIGNVTIVKITLTDEQNHSWDKEYKFHQTDPIDITVFKNQIIADIRKDLNISAVLTQVLPYVGQTFNLTV